MKFRDSKTGDVFEDINDCCNRKCSERTCSGVWCPLYLKKPYCKPWAEYNPAAAARIMGYEIVEEEEMEQTDKPRICEVLGVEVGERFSIDGYPTDYGPVQVCEDGKIRRVISKKEFPFANDGEMGHKIGSNALYYLLNHPDRIIRRPRFTEEEVTVLKALQKAGVAEIERAAKYETLKAKSQTVNDGESSHYEQWFLPKGLLPSLRPGQSVALSDIIDAKKAPT